jgi:hypothetical protein
MCAFRDAVERRDLDSLVTLFAEEVEFRSPVVFKPYHGRESLRTVLAGVSQVLEDWHCVREIGSSEGVDHVVHFRARIGELELEGADFLHYNECGAIDEMIVMVRPLSAANALAEAMRTRLTTAPVGDVRPSQVV